MIHRTAKFEVSLSDGTFVRMRLSFFENENGTESDLVERIERWLADERPGVKWTSIEEI